MENIISVRNPYDFSKSNLTIISQFEGLDIFNLTKEILETEFKDLDETKKQEICYKIQKKYKYAREILKNEYTEIIRRLIEKEISEPSRKYILTTACSALFSILAPIIIGTIISNTQPETPKDMTPDNWDNPTERTIPAKQPIPTEQITDTTDLHIDSLPLEEYQQAIEKCLRRCAEPIVWL